MKFTLLDKSKNANELCTRYTDFKVDGCANIYLW